MSILFLNRYNFNQWLKKVSESYRVYYPDIIENIVHYSTLNNDYSFDSDIVIHKALQEIRAVESLKGFFFNPIMQVGGLNKEVKTDVPIDNSPRLIIGAKNCDLRALMVHQRVYLDNEFSDAFYKSQLERTTIIAADCPFPAQTCFCNLLDLKPYPEKGSDIVLSAINSGYIFEPVSKKGEEFLHNQNHLFQEASSEDLKNRDEKREIAIKKLATINPTKELKNLPGLIEKQNEPQFWTKHADKCVECFGCLMVCPTCFCFLLYDTPQGEQSFKRYKIWDACYYAAYARVGGGMQDRAEFWKRYRNRFHCKFMHFKNKYDFYACSGCGRCYSVCMGKIDIRKILSEL